MIKYAKLEDGRLFLAPDKIRLNGRVYTGKISDRIYREAGYLPIVPVAKPENTVEDGWEIVEGSIRKKYREYTPDEQSEISRMVILDGDEAEEYESYKDDIEPVLEEVFG